MVINITSLQVSNKICLLLVTIWSLLYSAGLLFFFQSTSTSLFTCGTIYYNWNNFHEYLIQHYLKSGGTKDHFRQFKSTWYWKDWLWHACHWVHLENKNVPAFIYIYMYISQYFSITYWFAVYVNSWFWGY
jgi:hypothetical protein